MCGRFLLATRPDIVVERYGAHLPLETTLPRYNIAPGQDFPVLRQQVKDEFCLARWGIKLNTAKKLPPLINVRSDSLRGKKGWHHSLMNYRCLIPASGFYEWKKGQKSPFLIRINKREIISFAGIYQVNPKNECVSFAIITVNAGKEIRPIHHRSPKILTHEEEKQWLKGNLSREAYLLILESETSLECLIKPASINVNKVVNDYPELLIPEGEQQTLL